ncbi:hypothetical protein C8C83_4835 [Flavobacterium sp. 90]|uniref:hypothetical protein n=1 Tax=unclassified Flavobacterium TaxID=196869 RepID=UPI000EB20747|nr:MULTISPECIES: hypothetical protein [unclassified Flavobacterium]RKR05485.1 hypothetical protein C8C82_5177 [Flavobacterium sp. 81]TCK56800.1 hypothetical protein C8C83_4835 [Flavobacterium sp. 90]
MTELDDDCENGLEKVLEKLKKSEKDIVAGRTIDFSDFKEKLRIKYGLLNLKNTVYNLKK